MKNIFILFLFVTLAVQAQRERVQIQGSIISSNKEELGGITIFNNASLEGTVTNENGLFFIDVQQGDRLDFRAVQFSNFKLVVSAETVKNKTLNINLQESVNELDEVRITNGSFMIPVKRTVAIDPGISSVSQRNINIAAIDRKENIFSDKVRQPEEYPIRNEAFLQTQPRIDMFNFLGLLGGLIFSNTLGSLSLDGNRGNEEKEEFEVAILKNKFSTAYLVEFLEIDEADLYDFMYFARDRGLDDSYFTPEKELDLLQFLSESAVLYKKRKNTKN